MIEQFHFIDAKFEEMLLEDDLREFFDKLEGVSSNEEEFEEEGEFRN